MEPYVLCVIFARGGSKGVPRKNIRPLAGKPLLGWAIEKALRSRRIDRVVVSTDDPEIAEVAKSFGAEVPFLRPAELATDEAPEWLSWQHALDTLQADPAEPRVEVIVTVPCTAPLGTTEDVDTIIEALLSDPGADAAIAVTPARRNPYFNMVVLDEKGYARVAIKGDAPVHRRQAAPRIYDIAPVALAARPEFVMRSSLYLEGKVRTVEVPELHGVDIDSELDFAFAEFLLERRRQGLL